MKKALAIAVHTTLVLKLNQGRTYFLSAEKY